MTATKSDLIDKLAEKFAELKQEDIVHIVDIILEYIKEELSKGNRIEIRGFGSLSVRKRKYAGKDEYYNTIYYRMSQNLQKDLLTLAD